MSQQDQEAYNRMLNARNRLTQEAVEEHNRHGKSQRYKDLILGIGALCEILENIDAFGGRFMQVRPRERTEVSKWRAVIGRLTNGTSGEGSGNA